MTVESAGVARTEIPRGAPGLRELVRHVAIRYGAALLILIACILSASTYRYFGHTWDEPEHLAAGLQLLDRGVYSYDVQHPPLGRLAIALGPWLDGAKSYGEPGPSGAQEGRDILYRSGKYDEYLRLARLGTLPFLIVLLGTVWFWTREYFGVAAAAVAVFLLCCTPPLLGHAALATLDVPGAALCTLALFLLLRWFDRPSWGQAVATAVISGLAIATKLSAVPFIGISALVWAVVASAVAVRRGSIDPRKSARFVFGAVAIVVLALFCATLSYGIRFKYLIDASHPLDSALDWVFGDSGLAHDFVYAFARHVPLPAGTDQLIGSFQALLWHNAAGHLSYFLGRTDQNGWWDFYPVALGVKTPIPFLLTALGGLGYLLWRSRAGRRSPAALDERWSQAAPAMAFVAILLFCCSYSRINIGVRHVIILYPLMAIAAAAGITALWRRTRHSGARAALVSLMLWQASSLWTAYPDYLPYFNALAADHPERILVDSDLDWGQDLERLRHRVHQLHITNFSFIYAGTADLSAEHLDGARILQPFTSATGWVAASLYAKSVVASGRAYAWLDKYTPSERIGKSILLYHIPEQRNSR